MKTVKIQMYDQDDLKTLALKDRDERFLEVCEHRLALKDTNDQDKKLKTLFDEDAEAYFHSEEYEGQTAIKFTGFKIQKSIRTTVDLKDESFSRRKSKDIDAVYKVALECQEQMEILKTRQAKALDELIPLLEKANENGHNYKLDVKEIYSLRRA